MNIFSIGFLVLISLVGGVIALLADNLGRTIGKKRITFRRLRPRRTAQVFTFSAGAVIPLLTVAVVAFASEGVRRWFVEGPALVSERDRLSEDLKKIRTTLTDLENQRQEKLSEISRLTEQRQELEKKLTESQAKLAAAESRVKELNAKLAPLTARLASAEKKYKSLLEANELLTRQNATTKAQLEKNQKELSQLTDQYGDLQAAFLTLNSQKAEAERYQIQLDRENAALLEQIGKNQKLITTLSADLNQTAAELQSKTAELNEMERQRERAALDLDRMKGQVKDMREQFDALMSIWGNSRQLPPTFLMGQELARVSVPANLSPADAENALSRLLRGARANAEERGAKPKGSIPVAGIMDRTVDGRPLTSDAQQKQIVDRITGLSEDFLLIATSSLNAFKGEPVAVDVRTMRNPIVFTQGEMVAETRIDGDRTENVIVEQITEFVRTQVRERARTEGMVPILGQDGGYGVLDQDVLLDLMRTARANNRRVRLQAIAPKDIRAGDPLELEYRIR